MEDLETNNTIEWYEHSFTLEQAMDMIQGSMKSAVRNYVAVGFYLKAIRDRKLFEEAGYRNFEEFVRDKYDRDKGWASRCIKVNDQLSKGGNTPLLSDQYKDYSVSQLIELASMTEEQRAQVTPETPVREMKGIRNPKPAETEKVVTSQLPEETIYHFTDGERNIDSAYGATISVIVKAYLATGLQEECMVTAWGDTYKVLRRPQITVFYTDAGTTLFDVENSRLEKEYQYWYGSKGVVDQEEPPNQEGDATISQQAEPQTESESQEQDDQPLSAYGTPKMERPEDSLIAMAGCEGGHSCFCCHMECGIRQEDCNCVDAPLGNPFPCQTIDIIGNLREDMGSCCQFVDLDKAYHRAGDNEPVPCCKDCGEVCEYRCSRSTQKKENQISNDEAKLNQDEGYNPWEEPEEINESWNLGDLPQAKEKYVAKLARAVVNEYGSRMIFRLYGLSGKEAVKMLTSKCGGDIDIGDGVVAYATDGTIEFYSGDTDLGVCSYSKFETQVEKALEVWKQEQKEKTEKAATDLSEQAELPNQEWAQGQGSVIDAEFTDITEPEADEKPLTDLQIAQEELERAKRLLKNCLAALPDETDVHIRAMKIKVAALASYVCDLDDIENPPPKPELPPLKNNDQRAAFVDAYEAWPLWIETVETGERYYRYDLEDGTSMVVKVYHALLFDYKAYEKEYGERFSEGWGKNEYYLLKDGKFFRDCEANRSTLIDKLKEIQKKG